MRVFDRADRPPTAVVLDLDGTLYPREAYVAGVLRLVADLFTERYGRPRASAVKLAEELREEMEADWGRTSVTEFVYRHGASQEDWSEFRNARFTIDYVPKRSDIASALERLRKCVRTALVTNNAAQATQRVLRILGLTKDHFDTIVSAEDHEGQAKPHVSPFVAALDRLGVDGQDCFAIGDRYEVDVEPILSLGGSGIEIDGPDELSAAIDYICNKALGAPRATDSTIS